MSLNILIIIFFLFVYWNWIMNRYVVCFMILRIYEDLTSDSVFVFDSLNRDQGTNSQQGIGW